MGRAITKRVGSHASEGMRALWAALAAQDISQGELARKLGTTSGVVCRWLHGDRRPGRALASKIEALLGIDAATWDEPLGRASIPQLRAVG